MRTLLLVTTAIVGLPSLTAPSLAVTPATGNDYEVSISGDLRLTFHAADNAVESVDDPPQDRGYSLTADESEVTFAASAVTEGGVEYGFEIQVQTQTDDELAADETWVFVDGVFGRIEIGDQNDAADRLHVGGEEAAAGRGGFDGDPFSLVATGVAITSAPVSATFKATKAIYFTPRIAGLQGGVSFTPDSGQFGGVTPSDADFDPDDPSDPGELEAVISLGANFVGEVEGLSFTLSGVGEFGRFEAPAFERQALFAVGILLNYVDLSVGAGYVDFSDGGLPKEADTTGGTANGADGGRAVTLAASYTAGDWTVGATWLHADSDAGRFEDTGIEIADPVTNIFSLGLNYAVAPGLDIAVDANYFSLNNAISTDGLTAATSNDVDQTGSSYVMSVIVGF